MKLEFKIITLTDTSKDEFLKEFTFEEFNKWKSKRLKTNCVYIKYKFKKPNDRMWSFWNTENSKKTHSNKSKDDTSSENKLQRESRNSNLLVKGNKVVSLSMTPARKNKIEKYLNTKPLTSREISLLKSLYHSNTLSKKQLEMLNGIFHRADSRKTIKVS